jgi:hypothetical protein
MALKLTSPDPLASHLAPLAAILTRLERRLAACRAGLPQLDGAGAGESPVRETARDATRRPVLAIGRRIGLALLLMVA